MVSELKTTDANLLTFAFNISPDDSTSLEHLCEQTKEGIFIQDPQKTDLDLALTAISCVEIELPPVIVEQFT